MATEHHVVSASPPGSAITSFRRRLKWTLLLLALMGVMLALVWRWLDGTDRQVRTILAEVRWEERRNLGGGGFRALTGFVTDLMDRILNRPLWRGDYYFSEKLTALGTNAVPALLTAVESDRSEAARKISALALGDLAERAAVTSLVRALGRDAAPSVREVAAQALRDIGDTNAVPALLAALRGDANSSVRAECVQSVGRLGGLDLAPQLIAAAATETNTPVRVSYAHALADLQDRNAVPLLAGWLHTPPPANPPNEAADPSDWAPRAYSRFGALNATDELSPAVVLALGRIGGEAAFRTLMTLWHEESSDQIKSSLCEAFGCMGDARALPLLLPLLAEPEPLKLPAIEALGHLADTNAVASLVALLDDADKGVRQRSAEALGRIGSATCVPELARVAEQDVAEEVRASACAALGGIGAPAASELIIRALPRLDDNREIAVWALGHVGDSNAVPTLGNLLDDRESRTRFAAAYALAEIGGAAAADVLVAHLADQEQFARHGKACALAMMGRTEGLASVREGLRAKEEWRRFGAALALIPRGHVLGANEWEPLLADRSPSLRRLAGEGAAGRAMPALVDLLRDRDRNLRHYTARGLIFFHDPATLPALREACHDTDPDVREAARVAVRSLERPVRLPRSL